MVTIDYRVLPLEEIDQIKLLWEKLRSHHHERARDFKKDFEKKTFAERKKGLSIGKKAIKILVAQESNLAPIVGYCIASISEENLGEVDSIYIDERYRSLGIGKELMNRSFEWFTQNGIQDVTISVALGNEEALPFYAKFGFAPRTYILNKKPV
jgi:diamine N-acetyltransferase